MLYIERNEDGTIRAIHQSPTGKAYEQKNLMDEEVLAFLGSDDELESWIHLLSLSDVSIIRIIEDLVDVLVKKNVIMLTDLPREARNKLNERKQVRERMEGDQLLVDDII
ncbi:MAG TPA: hypothetical protein ENN06_00175 [Desulfobacteraceae bacterium]|nr:hypothetical protein [Desulfobacteraceae bacterium]